MNKYERQSPCPADQSTLPDDIAEELSHLPSEVIELSDAPPLAPPAPLNPDEVRTIVISLMLTMFLAALDQTIVATALPTIGRQFHDVTNLSWVITAYLLASTAVAPVFGTLSDIYGRRVMIITSLSLFVVGSVLCAIAPSMTMLIIARGLQGLGGGGIMPVVQTVISDVVTPRERGRYQAYFSSVWMAGGILGPVVGGVFAEHLHWSMIFWINLPLAAAALALLTADRYLATNFFTNDLGGNAMLYVNLIWIWGHPEVYILILPLFGVFSEVTATFSGKRLFGYTSMVYATVCITILSYLVWLHHFFTMGSGANVNAFFGITTMIISIPTGVKIFNWLFTMYRGRIRFELPMMWLIAFMLTFVIGGMTGVLLAVPPADFVLHNSLFLVAHFHNTIIGGALFGYLAGFLVAAPLGSDALASVLKEDPGMNVVFKDISTGVVLTLVFGFTLTTMSIILGQVSGIFEDKELIRSLDLMGVPRGFQFRSGALTVMGPVVALSSFGFLFGGGIASLMFFSGLDSSDVDVSARLLMAFGFLAVGWVVTLLAIVLVEPLRGYVLRTGGRKE